MSVDVPLKPCVYVDCGDYSVSRLGVVGLAGLDKWILYADLYWYWWSVPRVR